MFKYLDYAIIAIFTQNKALIYEWIPAIRYQDNLWCCPCIHVHVRLRQWASDIVCQLAKIYLQQLVCFVCVTARK